jgi:hypothetical protein
VNQQRFVVRRERLAQRLNLQAFVIVLAHEIRNHANVVEVKYLFGGFL